MCIGHTIMTPSDWSNLFNSHAATLALPGFLAGIFLTYVARKCSDEAMLPISMVIIPTLFYLFLFFRGLSIEDAREGGWVGEESPPVPVEDLFHLVDFGKVRWGLITEIIATWAGMYDVLFKLPPMFCFCSHTGGIDSTSFHNRYGVCGFIFFLFGRSCDFYGHGSSIRYKQ